MIRKRYLALAAFAAVGLTLALTASVGAQGGGDRAIFAVMTGAKEVDVNGEHHGDPNGRGSFSATLDGRQLCYGITVKNINDPVAAHIHRGGPKVAGPVVQPLDAADHGRSGRVERLRADLEKPRSRPQRNPTRYYVNVHTADLPNGAVRGQLFARSR